MTGRQPGLHLTDRELSDVLDGLDVWMDEVSFDATEAHVARVRTLRNKVARRLGVREKK